ncbi:uncharacterized protein LOC143276287 [Babylonia areolata]|uniref:uncharacterized protein LOC143276287 n=1 Tax=Babylonia areolata TaxID=304850 RepID=UPI003FCF6713
MLSQKPVTLSQKPVTLSHEPVTLSQELVTLSQKPVTLSQEPVTLSQKPVTLAQEPVTLSQKPVTLSQEPVTLSQKPPRPKPRSVSRPTPMPRSKSLGDTIESPSIHITHPGDEEDVFHREASDSDSHSSLNDDDDDDEDEELVLKPRQSTPLTAKEDKRPRSLKEIRRMQKTNTRPMIAPFTLPDHIVLPSRLKINASRRQFLSSENLDASPNTSLHEQFAAHKASQQQAKERLYKSPNKRPTSSFSSQDQLEKLHYMLNYSRQSESSFDRSLVDHLHEGCILTPEGRRCILDKTLSIENLQIDLPRHLRRFGSVTSLVETDIDTGETLETNFFPETNLDIFDHLFQSHQPLQRSASMSDLVVNAQLEEGEELDHEYEPRGRGLSLGPSHTHKSTGKGRFAHRKHQKSKSLCTLETNLDEVGEEGEDPALRRVPSVHELRVTKSLQKLNLPDWFRQSSLSKSSSCLLKYGSSSTMNSFSFSPSLLSSPCASTAPPAPNVVIKTRVVPPSHSRSMRSPGLFPSSSLPTSSSSTADRRPPTSPVKLPSDKLREKEKNKNLMPIPIVPFAQIRAMFEKKGKREGAKEADRKETGVVDPSTRRKEEEVRETKPKPILVTTAAKSAPLPSISISSEEAEDRTSPTSAATTTSVKRTIFEKQPPTTTATTSSSSSSPPPPVVEETFTVTTSGPMVNAPPQQQQQQQQTAASAARRSSPGNQATTTTTTTTNGVSDEDLSNRDRKPVSSPPPPPTNGSARTEVFPPSSSSSTSSSSTGRVHHPATEGKPPISPTSASEPSKPWSAAKDSGSSAQKSNAAKDGQQQPKSPTKDSKQQFSPSRSLRQFFGRSSSSSSKDKAGSSSEKKSEGGGKGGGGGGNSSLDSSFSSGDGVYEKEPRRIGVSETSRRFDSTTTTTTSRQQQHRRSDPDSSFSSSGEGPLSSGADRSLEGAGPFRTSSSVATRAQQQQQQQPQSSATFPSSARGSRPGSLGSSNSDRPQPAFSRFAAPTQAEDEDRIQTRADSSAFHRRLPGSGGYGHLSSSSENGEHVPEPAPPSPGETPATVGGGGEKKSVKETTV